MFCKNCGKENAEKAEFCIECGEKFSNDKNKKIKLNKKSLSVVVIVFALLISGILFFALRETKPSIKQLKEDFSKEYFENENYSFSKFEINFESNDKKGYYTAIVDIIYNNKKTAEEAQYEFIYNKNKEWTLSEIKLNEKDSHKSYPINNPSISEIVEEWRKMVGIEFSNFELLEDKTSIKLKNSEASYVYNAKTKTPIGSLSCEFKYIVKYDTFNEKWEIDDVSIGGNHVIETDFLRTWEGTGMSEAGAGGNANYQTKEKFILEITKQDGNQSEAVLTFKDNKYILSGTIGNSLEASILENNMYSSEYATIFFKDNNDKIRVSGSIIHDGTLDVEINTDYKGSDSWMYGLYAEKDIYELTMELKD